MKKKWLSILLTGTLCLSGLAAPVSSSAEEETSSAEAAVETEAVSDQEYIEETLNLANNEEQTWTYEESADAWCCPSSPQSRTRSCRMNRACPSVCRAPMSPVSTRMGTAQQM